MVWKPHVTVAAVIEQEGQFLLVEEHTDKGLQWNQPAGHLEPGESLQHAVIREVLEETGYHFEPSAWLGAYLWQPEAQAPTFLRFAFVGRVSGPVPGHRLDPDILRAHWQSREALESQVAKHRSPLVMRVVDDYCKARDSQALLSLDTLITYPFSTEFQHGK